LPLNKKAELTSFADLIDCEIINITLKFLLQNCNVSFKNLHYKLISVSIISSAMKVPTTFRWMLNLKQKHLGHKSTQ